jgi:carboxylesterase type B
MSPLVICLDLSLIVYLLKIDAKQALNNCFSSMVSPSMFVLNCVILILILHTIIAQNVYLNTTSGHYQGKEVIVNNVSIEQYFGIPYGEQPLRFQMPILREYSGTTIRKATQRTAGCLQAAGGLSYGPFELSDMYDEDCLTLNIFVPKTPKSSTLKAIMVFCHGGSNQVGSASLFDGSAVASIGDVIVITINYRLNILGFLTPGPDIMSGNYGLHDQILALKWVSINAKQFNGDAQRITYVGHSAGAANAVLLAMSKRSDGLIARVIAQSGCPLNQW